MSVGNQSKTPVKGRWWRENAATLLVGVVSTFAGAAISLFVMHRQSASSEADIVLNAKIDTRADARILAQNIPEIAGNVREIKGQLSTLIPYVQMLAASELKSSAALKPQAFENALPRLSGALTAARATQLQISADTKNALREQFVRVDQNAPFYWPAASALISLRPAISDETQVPAALAAIAGPPTKNLGDCLARPMTILGSEAIPELPPGVAGVVPFILHDCTLYLDDVAGFEQPKLLGRYRAHIPGDRLFLSLSLVRVQVIYRGGPIIPIVQLAMYGCSLAFNVPNSPSPSGRTLFRAILEAPFTDSTLTVNLPPAS